mmetsp:Transcript_50093/g.140485  ORF Transcript_50093/g.140485 Transcript_50093/m.140485 type:complete len:143 (+) Transcript_50093:1654-2082(+)
MDSHVQGGTRMADILPSTSASRPLAGRQAVGRPSVAASAGRLPVHAITAVADNLASRPLGRGLCTQGQRLGSPRLRVVADSFLAKAAAAMADTHRSKAVGRGAPTGHQVAGCHRIVAMTGNFPATTASAADKSPSGSSVSRL